MARNSWQALPPPPPPYRTAPGTCTSCPPSARCAPPTRAWTPVPFIPFQLSLNIVEVSRGVTVSHLMNKTAHVEHSAGTNWHSAGTVQLVRDGFVTVRERLGTVQEQREKYNELRALPPTAPFGAGSRPGICWNPVCRAVITHKESETLMTKNTTTKEHMRSIPVHWQGTVLVLATSNP
jgi:hypothetical protein